jgi:hypothetical protein
MKLYAAFAVAAVALGAWIKWLLYSRQELKEEVEELQEEAKINKVVADKQIDIKEFEGYQDAKKESVEPLEKATEKARDERKQSDDYEVDCTDYIRTTV